MPYNYIVNLQKICLLFQIKSSEIRTFQISIDKSINISVHNSTDVTNFEACSVVFHHVIRMENIGS